MPWTDAQKQAIDARNCDLLVAAAAGSGKTAVLVERIFELVHEGADIEHMLIVTFTNAVASEMRERLSARFDAMGAEAHMRAQAQACRQAHIQTLHSFCRDICRSYFQAADVDPGFRIIDPQEAQLMAERALDEALLAEYEHVGKDLEALNALRGPDELRGMVIALYSFLCSRADADEWLKAQTGNAVRAAQYEYLHETALKRVKASGETILNALHIANADEGAIAYAPALRRDYDEWPDGADVEYLMNFTPQRLSAAKGMPKCAPDAPAALLIKALRKAAKNMLEAAKQLMAILAQDRTPENVYLDSALPALIRLERAFESEYSRRKRERSVLDFNDLEHHALRALADENVCRSVKAMFQYVFVDEYQDISLVQESILNRIARPRSLFMVGDIKQSIYRFRQADPYIFLNKYHKYKTVSSGELLCIDLNRNFRSRGNVLDFVNGVFERSMKREDYDVDYDDNAALKLGQPLQLDDPAVEIHLLGDDDAESADEDADDETPLDALTREESEAHVAAGIIKGLCGAPMSDAKTGKMRSIRPRDIVVLSRSIKSIAPHALDVLLGEGIPAYADAAGGYFDTFEVRQVLELMRIIDNRMRDYDLLGVLHSPMFGFSATDLGNIRACTPKGRFAAALEAYAHAPEADLDAGGAPEAAESKAADERDAALTAKVQAFIAKLNTWQYDARFMPLSDLVWTLLDETGYYVYVGALPDGVERQANLRLLCERAAAYESQQYGGLHGFLKYVEQLKRAGQDMTTASTLGEGDDVVRIMSVHKSKGLEFPIVIGINMGSKLRSGLSGDLVLSGDMGMGMYMTDAATASRRDTVARKAAALKLERDNLSEELRILYVMLTRARDRLILIGSVKNLKSRNMLWQGKAGVQPSCMLDWIMPAAYDMLQSGEANVKIINHPSHEYSARHNQDELNARLTALRNAPADAETLERMRWRYPHEAAVLAPLKLTASKLGRAVDGPTVHTECRERPLFLSEAEMNAMEKGTATHTVMQWLHTDGLRGREGQALRAELNRQLDALRDRGTLTEAQRRGVRINMIARFFESEIGRRMLNSPHIEREWPFNLRMKSCEALMPDENMMSNPDEHMLVQGVIDCCFEESGEWVLIDYKTDRDDDPMRLKARYLSQLRLYERALEAITRMRVKQKGLFLLKTATFYDLTDE